MLPLPESLPRPPTILLVEDEVLVRTVLAIELREAGFQVIEAASAEEALSWLDAGGEIDLAFSDIRLRGAIDGEALARRLRARHPALPIILTSGSHRPLPADPLTSFIAKPYDISRAVRLVRQSLERTARDE